jgi:ribosome-binding factor A
LEDLFQARVYLQFLKKNENSEQKKKKWLPKNPFMAYGTVLMVGNPG